MSRKISLFLLALLSLSAPLSASIIYVSGDQTGTWSADTVIVTAEVRVPPGQSLTIVPGVEVLFSVYCKLIVDNGATLRAVGTAEDSIRFDVMVGNANWKGIRFLSASDSSRLEYCHLTRGFAWGSGEDNHGGAIYLDNSSPIMLNCLINNCEADGYGGAIYLGNNSNPTISDNTISGNLAGCGGGIECLNSSPTITGNIISWNQALFSGGIEIIGPQANPTITGNSIFRNAGGERGGGILIFQSDATIIGNSIMENSALGPESADGGGISSWECNPIIEGNVISGNEAGVGGGLFLYNSSPILNDNTINGNRAIWSIGNGGGICCVNSSNPTIRHNAIGENSVILHGGGIYCASNSNPIIDANIIVGNSTVNGYGGGIHCLTSSPSITKNTISENSATAGGGICCWNYSSPGIMGNTIDGNSAMLGGGIFSEYHSSPIIVDNTISGNAGYGVGGGGIACNGNYSASINGNTIYGNWGENYGGGIYCTDFHSRFSGNSIIGNSAGAAGGGIYCGPTISMINCILWDNAPNQIYGTPTVTYSDIQGGHTGTGNINLWPAFVDTAQDDYRLQWGSPCIDTGDPNPFYNDPDGTRADMGAWYYDQSRPVRVLLTPYNAPIQIPPEGGSFQYAIQATNIADSALITSLWCNLTLPNGTIFGPVLGPVTISLSLQQTMSRLRRQNISAHAPAGLYHYNAYAVAAGDTSQDSFTFVKLGSGVWDLGSGDWTNMGEEFESPSLTTDTEELRTYNLELSTSPNPFNPATAISYKLSANSYVSLRVYDTAGRLVTELLNGWQDAGNHQITFDGMNLPSGIYFTNLKVGDYSQVQKMALLK